MSAPAKQSSSNDKDMEKDTWNFKSMTDDTMDFGFGSPADNKNNAFKLDMGFDLGGDFGKMSDVPEFDFSGPAKKTTITKESSDDKSSGNGKQKKDLFFSYDFDALGDFSLDSSTSKKGSETAGRNLDKLDSLDFGLDLPVTGQAASKAKTDVKAHASPEKENQISKTTDTMVVEKSTHSKNATLESMDDSTAAQTMWLQPEPVDTSPLKPLSPIMEEIDEPCSSNESAELSRLHDSETAHTAVNRETSPEVNEICKPGSNEVSPRDPNQNAHKKMTSTMESNSEKTEPSISSQLSLDKTKHQQEEMAKDTRAEIADETRKTLCDPDTEYSQKYLSRKISSGTRLSQTAKVQDSIAKLAPSHSVLATDNQTPRDPNAGDSQTKFSTKIPSGTCPSRTAKLQDSSAKVPLAPSHRSVLRKDTQAEPGDQTRKTLRDPDPNHSQTTLSEKISPGDLPWDLESHILSMVPANSLANLKPTCKKWCKLFKDPKFIKKNFGTAAREVILLRNFSYVAPGRIRGREAGSGSGTETANLKICKNGDGMDTANML